MSLQAENKSRQTVAAYTRSVAALTDYLIRAGMPTSVDAIRREHVEAFLADQLDRWKPSTARLRFASLQQFFRWAKEEGEVVDSPMANIRQGPTSEARTAPRPQGGNVRFPPKL